MDVATETQNVLLLYNEQQFLILSHIDGRTIQDDFKIDNLKRKIWTSLK